MDATIRRLGPADAEAYVALRREMLLDTPFAFGSSPEDDRGSDLEGMRRLLAKEDGDVVFGACVPALVGAIGVMRERGRKERHKVALWGMYVAPRRRRSGIGRRLVEAAIAHARTLEGVRQVHLGVNERTPGARVLYESVGFARWGTEPRGILHESEFADEHHMVLLLDGPPSPGPT